MKVWKSEENLYYVEAGHLLVDSSVLLYQAEQLASCAVFHHKNQVFVRLKGKFHIDHKRMIRALHDVTLVHDYPFFLVLHDYLLIDYFHGIKFPVFFKSAQKHLWESSWPDQFQNLKRLKADLLFFVDAVVYSTTWFQVKGLTVKKFAIDPACH